MFQFILAICLLPSFFMAAGEERPPSVLIIGGGPAGLASAIEAANHGCSVTVVEKRNEYTRTQPIVLSSESLDLLKKWDVFIPEMMTGQSNDDKSPFFGLVRIQFIEKRLAKKCSEIGITFIYGELKEFSSEQMVIVDTEQENMFISYDILIAADGSHSLIKKALSIQTTDLGSAIGAYIVIPNFSNHKKISKNTDIKKINNYFIRAIQFPYLTSISIQSSENISLQSIRDLLETIGMKKEVSAIDQGYISESASNIPIQLAQAQTFCDPEKSVILIGDATLSVSFLSGVGLNTTLSSTKLLGDFLQSYPYDRKAAFENYNGSMKKFTDEVIKKNMELFIDNKT